MKFSKREDIEAPIDVVFKAASDFAAIERAALRRGIEVTRRDDLALPGPGLMWAVRAPIRGRMRDIEVEVTAYSPDTALTALARSGGIAATITLELVALSRTRTRLQAGLDLRASTLSSRLLLQSLRLAKASLDRRFARRVAEFASLIESRHQRPDRMPPQPRRGSAG